MLNGSPDIPDPPSSIPRKSALPPKCTDGTPDPHFVLVLSDVTSSPYCLKLNRPPASIIPAFVKLKRSFVLFDVSEVSTFVASEYVPPVNVRGPVGGVKFPVYTGSPTCILTSLKNI